MLTLKVVALGFVGVGVGVGVVPVLPPTDPPVVPDPVPPVVGTVDGTVGTVGQAVSARARPSAGRMSFIVVISLVLNDFWSCSVESERTRVVVLTCLTHTTFENAQRRVEALIECRVNQPAAKESLAGKPIGDNVCDDTAVLSVIDSQVEGG